MPDWLLYGANGYTGRLIAEAAVARGLRPVLAGRNGAAIQSLAAELGCRARVFPLDDRTALDNAIAELGTVLLAAGPFSATSAPVVDACLRTGGRYLDITGEIDVFEACFARHAEAVQRGAVLLPGVGFDVVPSDCLAASLAARLPSATHLDLALASVAGQMSRGTALTSVHGMARGNAYRANGIIRREPLLSRARTVPFFDKERPCVAIPWGDVSTAYRSTGIGNISFWQALPPGVFRWRPIARWLLPLVALPPIRSYMLRRALASPPGPDAAARARGRSELWGAVRDDRTGQAVSGTLTTPNGYQLTSLTAVECAERVARGDLTPGAYTPSQAFGAAFITTFDSCLLRV